MAKTTKAAASRAAKTLSNPKASKAAKSAAGKTLASRSVKAAPKRGAVRSSTIKRAVKSVTGSRKKR